MLRLLRAIRFIALALRRLLIEGGIIALKNPIKLSVLAFCALLFALPKGEPGRGPSRATPTAPRRAAPACEWYESVHSVNRDRVGAVGRALDTQGRDVSIVDDEEHGACTLVIDDRQNGFSRRHTVGVDFVEGAEYRALLAHYGARTARQALRPRRASGTV